MKRTSVVLYTVGMKWQVCQSGGDNNFLYIMSASRSRRVSVRDKGLDMSIRCIWK